MNLAPILLFTYKKVEPLKLTVEALTKNQLASKSKLYIFSDGPAKEADREQVKEVRAFIRNITGFKEVILVISETNKGLATSIISGVSEILKFSDTVIVLEDDLIASTNFLTYMNKALEFYNDNPKIVSIAGYTPTIKLPKDYDYDTYFTLRASSWGWATWRNKWEAVDWDVSGYESFKADRSAQRSFNQMGSDMTGMLKKQMEGKSDSWAIRWCYHQFQHGLYTVFPITSKIQNIGFMEGATHTKGKDTDKRFATPLDRGDQQQFQFCSKVELLPSFIKQFVFPYSLRTRAFYKMKNLLRI